MRKQSRFGCRLFVFVLATTLAWPQMASAQPPADEQYTLRTYEVGDLVLNIQDHPYSDSLKPAPMAPAGGGFGGGGGGFGGGGGGGGFFSVPDEGQGAGVPTAMPLIRLCQFGGGAGGEVGGMGTAQVNTRTVGISIDDLRRVLTSVVSADSWAVNGGEGQVEPLGTALVIWQTKAIHAQIEHLLTGIRAGFAQRKTVTIDARWVLLDSDELGVLMVPDQEGVPQVDRKVLSELTRRGGIRGMTSCFSGQLVYVVSGTRRNFVSSYIPVVGSTEAPAGRHAARLAAGRVESAIRFVADTSEVSGGKGRSVGYQPVIEKPNFGALLEIRPTVTLDKTAVVELKSTITVPGEQTTESTVSAESAAIAPQVDRIAIETQEFATTLRMPLGTPVLVGGLTYVPAAGGLNEFLGQESEKPQLYLVLEVR